jgi:radical SAM protein with 4Fe4S-binding SPASM domain
VFEIAEQLEVDLLLDYYSWYQTLDSGARHTAIMREKMNVTPWSWKGYLWDVNKIDPETVTDTVKRIKNRRWKFPYIMFPDLEYDQIPAYYRDHSNTFGHSKCTAPWLMAEIMPNGDVVTCRDFPDVVVGNIMNDSLLNIWNSRTSRDFRMLLKEQGGLLPVCTRCCGLLGC